MPWRTTSVVEFLAGCLLLPISFSGGFFTASKIPGQGGAKNRKRHSQRPGINGHGCQYCQQPYTPRSLTVSLPLKNGGWKTILSYWNPGNFSGGERLNFGRVVRTCHCASKLVTPPHRKIIGNPGKITIFLGHIPSWDISDVLTSWQLPGTRESAQ